MGPCNTGDSTLAHAVKTCVCTVVFIDLSRFHFWNSAASVILASVSCRTASQNIQPQWKLERCKPCCSSRTRDSCFRHHMKEIISSPDVLPHENLSKSHLKSETWSRFLNESRLSSHLLIKSPQSLRAQVEVAYKLYILKPLSPKERPHKEAAREQQFPLRSCTEALVAVQDKNSLEESAWRLGLLGLLTAHSTCF